jgi:hypothetical protein
VKSAQEYRRKVEECKAGASRAARLEDKTGWLQLAEGWEAMAGWAEKNRGTTRVELGGACDQLRLKLKTPAPGSLCLGYR